MLKTCMMSSGAGLRRRFRTPNSSITTSFQAMRPNSKGIFANSDNFCVHVVVSRSWVTILKILCLCCSVKVLGECFVSLEGENVLLWLPYVG